MLKFGVDILLKFLTYTFTYILATDPTLMLCRLSSLHNDVFCRTESFTLLQDKSSCGVEIYV